MQNPTRVLTGLIALSLTTTLLARFAPGGTLWVSFAVLLLAGWKARLVLNGYLGLSTTRIWSRGFNTIVIAFLIAVSVLYIIAL